MLGEISNDFYCSAGFYQKITNSETGYCRAIRGSCGKLCSAYHRKHPTLEQYKKEYGKEYRDDGAVYCRDSDTEDWKVDTKFSASHVERSQIVCACTPCIPNRDWRP